MPVERPSEGVHRGKANGPFATGVLVGVTWLVVVLALPETLRSRVGNGSVYAGQGPLLLPIRFSSPLAPPEERGPPPPRPSIALFWRLLCYPPIGISSVYNALLFANYFAVAVDLPVTLTDSYHWSTTAVGGGYVALGVAIILGSLVTGRFSDWRRARLARKSATGHVEPEARLLDHIWGALLCGAGSVMYGWCAAHRVHPAALIVATFLSMLFCPDAQPRCLPRIFVDIWPYRWLWHVVRTRWDVRVPDGMRTPGRRRRHGVGEHGQKPGGGGSGRCDTATGCQNGNWMVLHRVLTRVGGERWTGCSW